MKNWIKIPLLLLVVAVFGMTAGYLSVSLGNRLSRQLPPVESNEPAAPIGKLETDIEDGRYAAAAEPSEQAFSDGLWIQETGGEVCVFRKTTSGEQVFVQKLKISLGAMRAEDRRKFKEGFMVSGQAELAQLIEDFSS